MTTETAPSRTGRRIGYAALAALVAVAAAAVVSARRSPEHRVSAPPATTSPSPSETPSPTPEQTTPAPVQTTEPVVVEPTSGPTRLAARYWDGPHDPLLLAGSNGVTFWDSDRHRRVAGPSSDAHLLVPVGGGTVVLDREPSGDFPAPAHDVWFVAYGATTATRVGRAQDAVAGAADGTAWLVDYEEDDAHAGWTPTARKVDLRTGRRLATRRLPYQWQPLREVTGGRFLLTPTEGFGETQVWDPAAGKVVRTFPGPAVDATATTLLWMHGDCIDDCIRFSDIATGRTRARGGRMRATGAGALSPDGRWAAFFSGGDFGSERIFCVVDSVTGEARFVDNARLDVGVVGGVAWSRDSASAYLTVNGEAKGQVALWRRTWSAVRLLRDDHRYDTVAAT